MDCTQAQATISEVLDGGAADRATLEAAKQHCRECPDCAAFVRGLNAVKRAPLPEPDPALVDRVMVAVRREATARAASAAVAGAGATGESAEPASHAAPEPAGIPSEPEAVAPRAVTRMRTPALVAWIAAAAVLVVGAGTVGVLGIRLMSTPRPAQPATLADSSITEPPVEVVPAPSASAPPREKTTAVSAVPSYITLGSVAYRFVGVSTTTKGELTRIGSTTSSLDGGEQRLRDVFQKLGQPSVYVENDKAEILEFQPVERQYQGRSYRLQSDDLVSFGTWPTLPDAIPQPTDANGSPTFFQAGSDASGVAVYQLASSTATEGIALAPGTSQSDPAGGNPGWTWWTPSP